MLYPFLGLNWGQEKPDSDTDPKPVVEYWYRYEDYTTAPIANADGDWGNGPSTVHVRLRKMKVLSHTPKGVWLELFSWPDIDGAIQKKFALRDSRKRFACPTLEEAKESFIRRKKRQRDIYLARAGQAEAAIVIVNGGSRQAELSIKHGMDPNIHQEI